MKPSSHIASFAKPKFLIMSRDAGFVMQARNALREASVSTVMLVDSPDGEILKKTDYSNTIILLDGQFTGQPEALGRLCSQLRSIHPDIQIVVFSDNPPRNTDGSMSGTPVWFPRNPMLFPSVLSLLFWQTPYEAPPQKARQALQQSRVLRAALAESEERFERMAENAPDMIFRWSYAQGFEYVSPASVDVIGYTPEEHYKDPGLGYRSILADDIPIYESTFSGLADPEGPRRYCVIRWIHKQGHLVHVEMRMAPLFDEFGNLVAIEGIARDISQHIIARERLSELTNQIINAHEAERREIAYELHDDIGQSLTIANMHISLLQKSIDRDAPELGPKIQTLAASVTESLAKVRALSHELRPPLLDELGWRPAVEALCDSFSMRSGIPVSFDDGGLNFRIDSTAELSLYRIVQESLTNAARHADPTSITVTAGLSGDVLTTTIEDNGKGFDIQSLDRAELSRSGLGLLGMRERAERVNGTLSIETQPGKGTKITTLIPVSRIDE